VRLVRPAMGHAKPGQGPVIRNVPKSLAASLREAAFFLQFLKILPISPIDAAGLGSRAAAIALTGQVPRRRSGCARHGDTSMSEYDESAQRHCNEYIASALRTEGAISRSVAVAFPSTTRLGLISAAMIASASRLAALRPGCQ
jgi:hypothetical protein